MSEILTQVSPVFARRSGWHLPSCLLYGRRPKPLAPLWFTMHCVMGDRAAIPKGNSKARRMGQDESRGSWFAERKRPLAFAMSLTLYWPLFVLFVFPPELFPEAPAALATCAQTGVVAFVFVLGAVVALAQSGRGERRSALLVAAGRRYTVAVSLVLLAAVVGALLAFRLSDQPAPSVFFWLYPLAMGFYAFSLSFRLASAAQTYLYNRLAMLVAGSLLLSFLSGRSVAGCASLRFLLFQLGQAGSCSSALRVLHKYA